MLSTILRTSFRILTKFSTLGNHVHKSPTSVIQCSVGIHGAHSVRCIFSNVIPKNYKTTEPNSVPDVMPKCSSLLRLNQNRLQSILTISTTEAKDLIKRHPKLKTCSLHLSEDNYQLCIKAGIENALIVKYPMLLTVERLEKRIEYIKRLATDINLIAPLLLSKHFFKIIDYAKLEESFVPYGNRIIYLSNLFNLDSTEIAEKCMKHLYVFSMSLQKLESILKTLLDYGVEPRNIINDCWALRYSPQIAEERLKRSIESNVPVKTWMIRCPDQVFIRCINRRLENRKILGSNSTVEEYLSKRLECSLENAKYLTEKYPAIMKMSILKMKEILDYLYEQGFTPAHVCRVPRILVHSQETTKVRIQQLKDLGYIPPSLANFCKSKRDFDKLLNKYVKRKKATEVTEES